jgi:hypothetical protein
MGNLRLMDNFRVSLRGLVALTVTVNVISEAASVPPSQVAFSLTVAAGFNKTLDQKAATP